MNTPVVLNPSLTAFERHVIADKGTEMPRTGQYLGTKEEGIYSCKNCGNHLFHSKQKFESSCGWPSFDEEIAQSVRRIPDADGLRTEIVCNKCFGHLGHVFLGEGYTPLNQRHCVNSVSLVFHPKEQVNQETAILASGCFWGTEYHFSKFKGVLKCETGYAGGAVENPTYKQVCSGTTGHLESVKVTFNPEVVSYEELLKLFFETHDFTQTNGQGPDIGSQYLSAIFCLNEAQEAMAYKLITTLKEKNFKVATEVRSAKQNLVFWKAENYHQNYYFKNASTPYCHIYRKVF
jgi:peptide methionine sulfoxide reductase msrA/msrB